VTSYILGLSAFYHDSSAALLVDGELVAAVQEERLTRIKQDNRFPVNSIKYCLNAVGKSLEDLDGIFYYEDPQKKLKRIISTYFNFGLKGCESFVNEIPDYLTKKFSVKRILKTAFSENFGLNISKRKIYCIDHHKSHAASAFFVSPHEKAAVLCIDGVGEWATTSAWLGEGNKLTALWQIKFPHSLGLLYSAFTFFCGFKVDSGEYKLMGLAPYGTPRYCQHILDNLIDIKADGSFWINMDYFDYATGSCMISEKFEVLFGGPRREPEHLITQREFDLAASIQVVLEDIVIRLATTVRHETNAKHLCMAGGVALNCVSNGKLLAKNIFESIWIQPAAGDSGGAIGAALVGWHEVMKNSRINNTEDRMSGSYLGPEYSDEEIKSQLSEFNAHYTLLKESELPSVAAKLLTNDNVIGWFQGRMEFGPRALGARSIIGDPRSPKMQNVMNLKIKNRESFRPFAPAILEEHAQTWFKIDVPSPYMLFVVPVQESQLIAVDDAMNQLNGIEKLNVVRSKIPAVTHVDSSARVQTVSKKTNAKFHALINEFYVNTGCPLIINTSFNVRGEPIVENPNNAYVCFMRTQMDYLVIGNYLLKKSEQPIWIEKEDWRSVFPLD